MGRKHKVFAFDTYAFFLETCPPAVVLRVIGNSAQAQNRGVRFVEWTISILLSVDKEIFDLKLFM